MKLATPLLLRLQTLTDEIVSYETSRVSNLNRLQELFSDCILDDAFSTLEELFEFKAMNLLGISLSSEALGEIQKGRYVQLLVIASKKKDDKKSKNISLGYFGKAELLEDGLCAKLTEFVLRWRYEKSFQNVNHYKDLLGQLDV